MKKLAIAAALAAMTTTVSAQNATIYGVLDTGFQSHDTGSVSLKRAQDNALATSRLGVRGVEDLGGGLKAHFVLEGQLNPSVGSMGSTTVAANELFNREARIGLEGKFGEIRIGRQDVSYAQDVDTGTSQFGNFGNRPVNGTNIELGTDQKNVIKYITPRVAGLQAQVGLNTSNNAGATADSNGDQRSVYVNYVAGKLQVHAGYQKNEGATAAAERDFTTYGATYNLGFASVGYNYGQGDVSTTGDVTSKNQTLSARLPLGADLALHGIYSIAENGAQATANKGKGYTLGVSKTLSKRTTLYAAYTNVDNESNSTMYLPGQVAAPAAGADPKTTTVGISHVF